MGYIKHHSLALMYFIKLQIDTNGTQQFQNTKNL